MKSVLAIVLVVILNSTNARIDTRDFKTYMGALLDNEKWLGIMHELDQQYKHCFMGRLDDRLNVRIRIIDYVRKFSEKYKLFKKTLYLESDKGSFTLSLLQLITKY